MGISMSMFHDFAYEVYIARVGPFAIGSTVTFLIKGSIQFSDSCKLLNGDKSL